MPLKAVTFRLEEILIKDIARIAEDKNQSINSCITEALQLYRDHCYMQTKAVTISDDYLNATKGMVAALEHRINNRSNQLLSSIAIQEFILAKVLADSLDISPDALDFYRKQAAEFMKENNRVFSLKEMLE